ncbi:MAG: hypothetical protein ACREFO_04545 [Acetobacteraceae bacterium]
MSEIKGAMRTKSNDATIADAPGAAPPRYTRRLSDKILVAFHQACDQADLEVAEQLLRVLELMLTRKPAMPDHQRRRSMQGLVAAHERLWYLRHHNEATP